MLRDLASFFAVVIFFFSIAFAALSRAYCYFRLSGLRVPMKSFWVGSPGYLEAVVRSLPKDRSVRKLSRLLVASNIAIGIAVLVLILSAAAGILWFSQS